MDRVFLDANILFSAAYKPSTRLRALWMLSDVTLLSSAYAVTEAELNLSRTRPESLPELSALVEGLRLSVHPHEALLPENIELPEKDTPILLAALSARATHLLTGDKVHFGHLFGVSVRGVLIMPPSHYLKGK